MNISDDLGVSKLSGYFTSGVTLSFKMQHYLNLMVCWWYVHEDNVLVTESLAYLNSFLGLDVYNEQPVQQRLCSVNELVLYIDS